MTKISALECPYLSSRMAKKQEFSIMAIRVAKFKSIQILEEEHIIINDMIKLFTSCVYRLSTEEVPKSELELGLEFFSIYADNYHHGKEEDFLFPKIHELKLLRGGGPKCILFYEMFQARKDLAWVKSIVSKSKSVIKPYKLKSGLEAIVESKSPLSVPLEEHEMGYYSMQVLKAELEDYSPGHAWDSSLFEEVALKYLKMLEFHIRKEDECLFVALGSEMSSEEMAEVDAKFLKFDLENQAVKTRALEIRDRFAAKA